MTGDDLAGVDADAEAGLDVVTALPLGRETAEARQHLARGVDRAARRIGLLVRHAEADHEAVAGHAEHRATMVHGDAGQQVEVLVQQRHDLRGAQTLGDAREAAHVGEHHGALDAGIAAGLAGVAARERGVVLAQLDEVAGRVAQEELHELHSPRRTADAERDAAALELGARLGEVRDRERDVRLGVVDALRIVAAAAVGADQVDLAVLAGIQPVTRRAAVAETRGIDRESEDLGVEVARTVDFVR